MITVEGVARSLDPKLNIWDAAEPIVGDWLKKQLGPEAIFKDMKQNAGRTLRSLQRLPDTLAQAERGAAALENMASQMAEDGSQGKTTSGRVTKIVAWVALAVAAAATALNFM
jgi:ubiquinone biosynthesis protein